VIRSHTPFSLILFNSWSNGKSSWTVFGTSHPSCQWVLLCSIGSVDQWLNWHSEFIGKLDKIPYSLVVKFNVNSRLKENWTISGINSIWHSPKTSGKLSLLCLSSPTCSCGAACSWKEVNWILRYTKNIPNYGKNSFTSPVQRRDPCLISSSTTYGNTCLLEQEKIVREFLPRSLLIYSEDLSKFQGAI